MFDPIKLDDTLKKVTSPVTLVFPIATPMVPNPAIANLSLVTPIEYEPPIFDDVVEIPATLTISAGNKLCGDSASTK